MHFPPIMMNKCAVLSTKHTMVLYIPRDVENCSFCSALLAVCALAVHTSLIFTLSNLQIIIILHNDDVIYGIQSVVYDDNRSISRLVLLFPASFR